MNKRKQKERKMVRDFPIDWMIDILSKLPAKSLHRFRCVCQSWLSLLCPHFIRFHSNPQNLCFLSTDHYSILDCYEATSFDDANATVKVEYPFPSLPYYGQILASCDSWLLLLSRNQKRPSDLMLLNPSTREYKKFQSYYDFNSPSNDYFGICYDNSDNEYKVMQVRQLIDSDTSFDVFSSKTNSWTRIRDSTNWIFYIDSNVFSVKGVMHFLSFLEPDDRYVLLSLDLKGALKELPQPDHKFKIGDFSLASLRGNLWVHGYVSNTSDRFEMFEMKQYGVKESWIHVYSIKTRGWWRINQPLTFTKKGDVVIAAEECRELLIYNLGQDELKNLKFKGPLCSRWTTYSDSLITLNCDCSRYPGSGCITCNVEGRITESS